MTESGSTGVWATIVGQRPVVDLLRRVSTNPRGIAQSWLLCGPAGSGRSNVARAFAAALECPEHGCGECAACRHVLAGTHPDVDILSTDKVTIGIDAVRDLVETAEQAPGTAPWRIIIIEDVDRMMERTTNVLLKEIEEPGPRTIWLLCAPSAQDVLPTIRSRTRVVNLAVPGNDDVARFLMETTGADRHLAGRAARLAEGHIGIARLYATQERAMTDRDSLVVGVLDLHRASDAVLLADRLISAAGGQAADEIDAQVERDRAEFRRVNGLGPKDRIPPKIRGAFNAIGKKEDVRRRATRRSRDVLNRALDSIASVYRDVTVVQNKAADAVGLVNLENRSAIIELASELSRQGAIDRLDEVATARRRLNGNGNPTLVFEALFCALIP